MPKPAVTVLKFVGTVSLGLLTGLTYTLSTTLPATLLSLPTSPTCHTALCTLQRTSSLHRTILTSLTLLTLPLSFLLSPRRIRHPYLLWVSLLTVAGHNTGTLYNFYNSVTAKGSGGGGSRAVSPSQGSGSEDGRGEGSYVDVRGVEEGDVNGEEVRRGVEEMRVVEGIRTAVIGTGFLLGVIGIWGDAY
ncbi:hypothetical protein M501DRAFT_996513 [Patellaria atrata CBS 101060]|uniref:Uncharacterized protein n=1 Tax=Patellaria atrata CBS 101060 TaxID=1346257 RepID=A0A9P4VQT5_9PEZI|nr:hypothetical protein M501DRAFT_996513 [Patellaria atrata CBS 101060]